MKKFFLIAVLVVSANIAFAQDKYEFMTIIYQPAIQLNITIDGKFFSEKVELSKEDRNNILNTTPLLLKIKEYQDKGWEVMDINTFGGPFIYHSASLRKKKN